MAARLLLCATASVLAASQASAADFSTAFSDQSGDALGGFYLSVHGGAVFPVNTQVTLTDPTPPPPPFDAEVSGEIGYRVGGALGYRFNDVFSLEGEVSFSSAALKNLIIEGTEIPASGTGNTVAGMANVLIHLPTEALRPYVGAGIGGAWFWANDVTHAQADGDYTNDGDAAFAWQLIAGVDIPFNNGAAIGARYRYFQADGIHLVSDEGWAQDNLVASHSAEVVLTLPLGN